MVIDLLRRAGLEGFELLVNSVGDQELPPSVRCAAQREAREVVSRLCGDCQRRAETNPLRVLDCKFPKTNRSSMRCRPFKPSVRALPRAFRRGPRPSG